MNVLKKFVHHNQINVITVLDKTNQTWIPTAFWDFILKDDNTVRLNFVKVKNLCNIIKHR